MDSPSGDYATSIVDVQNALNSTDGGATTDTSGEIYVPAGDTNTNIYQTSVDFSLDSGLSAYTPSSSDGPGGSGAGTIAPNNGPGNSKPAWDANQPNCWAVGATNAWNGIKGTVYPGPSISSIMTTAGTARGLAIRSSGGVIASSGAKAAASRFALIGFLSGLIWNQTSEIRNELDNPTPCK